jgi:hypothetical protein
MTHLMLVGWVAAADPATPRAPAWLNTGAVVGLMVLAMTLIGGLLGVRMLGQAHKGDVKRQANMAASALIGVVVFLAFVGGSVVAVSQGSLDFLVRK